MKDLRIIKVILILFCFCYRAGSAQPAMKYIEHLTTSEGLSSNTINDILQGPKGYLWIGTQFGLNRYDGSEVEKYFETEDSNSLSGNIIYRMLLVDSSHIAIATNQGLSILDLNKNVFRRIYFPSDSLLWLYDNQLIMMERDTAGNLWIGTPSVIYRLDTQFRIQKKFTSGYSINDLEASRNTYVYRIMAMRSGEVLFWLLDGLYQWQPKEDTMVKIEETGLKMGGVSSNTSYFSVSNTSDGHLIYLNRNKGRIEFINEFNKDSASIALPPKIKSRLTELRAVSELPNGLLAISFQNFKGVIFIKKSGLNTAFFSSDNKMYLTEFSCGRWFCDNEGNYWIATGNGLIKINPARQRFTEKIFRKNLTDKKTGYELMSFLKAEDRFYIGTYGDGFYTWDIATGKIIHQNIKIKGRNENMVWNFRQQSADTLWLGTQQGLIWYNTHNNKMGRLRQTHPAVLDSFAITTQFTDSKGLVWIGEGFGRGVTVYDPSKNTFRVYPYQTNGYPYRYPAAIGEDAESNLWFISDATANLVKYDRKENRFEKITFPYFKGRTDIQTGGFYLDRESGTIWYSISSVGLVKYTIKNKKIKIYGLQSGLNTSWIYGITQDKNGVLWLSTSQGITSFNPKKERFVHYDKSDGLTENYLSAKFYFDKAEGRLYTGGIGKMIYFSPSEFHEKKNPMKVFLTKLVVNNQTIKIPADRKITLPWNNNDIAISFAGINLTNGNENLYAYQISDKHNWIEIGHQQQVQLASLNPGHYHFVIRAARKDGDWSPVTDHLDIYIKPPFYNTIWFYILCLLVAAGAVYGWYRYRLSQMLRLQNMRSRISHDLHDEIGSRLTNINMMSQIVSKQGVDTGHEKTLLHKIQEESEEISQGMREIVWSIAPENDSMEEALPRMLRFASDLLEQKNITLQAYIPDAIDMKLDMEKRRDLFLIFKEAIHNIVKHSNATQVLFRVKQESKNISLQILDNGDGFDKKNLVYENGLKYMRQRAEKHKWILQISGNPPDGAEVLLQMPYK